MLLQVEAERMAALTADGAKKGLQEDHQGGMAQVALQEDLEEGGLVLLPGEGDDALVLTGEEGEDEEDHREEETLTGQALEVDLQVALHILRTTPEDGEDVVHEEPKRVGNSLI